MDVGLLRLFGWRQGNRELHRFRINLLLNQELLAHVSPGLEAFLIRESQLAEQVDCLDLMEKTASSPRNTCARSYGINSNCRAGSTG
jgi:hypothetical protein